MKLEKGMFFNHPSFGLGLVISTDNNYADVVFTTGKKYQMSSSYIISNYDYKIVESSLPSIDEFIKSDKLDYFFDEFTKSKASKYINKRRIKIFDKSFNRIKAYVEGSKTYITSIEINNGRLVLSCSCPVSENCKHIYALSQFYKGNDYIKEDKIEDEIIDKDIKINDTYPYFKIGQIISIDALKKLELIKNKLINENNINDVIDYLKSHDGSIIFDSSLENRILHISNDIYQKIVTKLTLSVDNSSYKLLSLLKDKRKEFLVTTDNRRRNYYFNRTNFLLYKFINENYQSIEYDLPNNTLYGSEEKNILSYYFEKMYPSMKNMEYFTYVFTSKKLIIDTFNNIHSDKIKRHFYLVFNNELKKEIDMEIPPIEEFRYLTSLVKSKYSHDIFKKILNIAKKMKTKEEQSEYLSYLFSHTTEDYYSYFSNSDLKKILYFFPNNEALFMVRGFKK